MTLYIQATNKTVNIAVIHYDNLDMKLSFFYQLLALRGVDVLLVKYMYENKFHELTQIEPGSTQEMIAMETMLCFCLFSCYSHQSISDYSWEVYIAHSGVFAG